MGPYGCNVVIKQWSHVNNWNQECKESLKRLGGGILYEITWGKPNSEKILLFMTTDKRVNNPFVILKTLGKNMLYTNFTFCKYEHKVITAVILITL